MELKANECRYGNLIIGTYESEDDNLVHETICEFKFYDCYNNYYNVESKERIEEFTGFKPIPLTEEWLSKLGYDLISENHYVVLGHLIWKIEGRFYCDKNGMQLKHVHQLQNLFFALTGKELKLIH